MATPVSEAATTVAPSSSTQPVSTSAQSAAASAQSTTVPVSTVSYTAIVSAIQAAVRREIDSAVARALPTVSLPSSAGSAASTLPSTQAASGMYLPTV